MVLVLVLWYQFQRKTNNKKSTGKESCVCFMKKKNMNYAILWVPTRNLKYWIVKSVFKTLKRYRILPKCTWSIEREMNSKLSHLFIEIFSWSLIFFWANCSNHSLAALDLGIDVEQPLGSLIVHNHQTMQSIWRSMDWTLEDNLVDGLFFCATLTGRKGGQTHLYKQERKGPTSVFEAVGPRLFLGRFFREGGCQCRGLKCGVLWDCPSTPHPFDDPPTAPHVCCFCQVNWWDKQTLTRLYWR